MGIVEEMHTTMAMYNNYTYIKNYTYINVTENEACDQAGLSSQWLILSMLLTVALWSLSKSCRLITKKHSAVLRTYRRFGTPQEWRRRRSVS